MDDIIILAPDKKTANRWKEEIRQFLTDRLRLDLNRRTAVRPAGRVEFVGYMVTSRSLRLRKQTTRRIKSAFRGICKKYFSGRMTREEFDRRAASYNGMIQRCKADGLRNRLNEANIQPFLEPENGRTTFPAVIPKAKTKGSDIMTETIIVALITGSLALAGTLGGSYLANRKSAALIAYRLEQLEAKVQAHNNLVERTFALERHNEVQDEKLITANRRIQDLEKAVEKHHG